jgi:hypothetical protein
MNVNHIARGEPVNRDEQLAVNGFHGGYNGAIFTPERRKSWQGYCTDKG